MNITTILNKNKNDFQDKFLDGKSSWTAMVKSERGFIVFDIPNERNRIVYIRDIHIWLDNKKLLDFLEKYNDREEIPQTT